MGRRTVSLDDGSLRVRYFGKFQCGIVVFYYFFGGFAVFGPSLRPLILSPAEYSSPVAIWLGSISRNVSIRDVSNLPKFHAFIIKVSNFGR